jgi:hypothetical protein
MRAAYKAFAPKVETGFRLADAAKITECQAVTHRRSLARLSASHSGDARNGPDMAGEPAQSAARIRAASL